MATTQEAIARLRMIFETQGADAAAAEMKKLEASSTSLGTSSLNLDRAFTGLERRYSETARATAEYERSMRTLNAAVAQNPALAERAAAVQQTIAARYQATMQAARQAGQAQTALGVGMQAMAAQASAASASTGIMGSVLQTFGKGGAAAAIGIGAAVLAIKKLDEGVHGTAQYARDIKNFADATGLTTAQVQGLNKEASRFGISTDEMRSGLMRFTSTFDEVRGGGGALLETIRKIDSGLGEQAISAANEEEALNVLAAAYRKAGNEFERARLLRAAFGRGGQAMAPLIENLDLGQITDKWAGRGLSKDIIDDLKRLEGEINTIGGGISNKIYSLFAVPWLEAEKAVLKYLEAVARNATSLVKGGITPSSEDIPELMNQQAKLIENAERLRQLLDQPQGKATFAAMTQELEKTKEALKTVDYWLEKLQATKPGGALTTGEVPFEARAKDAQLLVQTLGGLATVQERVLASTYQLETAYNQLGASGKARINEMREALEAAMQVQAELSQVAPGTYQRQLEQIQAIKAEYPGLVAQDAIRMKHLDDQLRIAQAMPGVARMEAEEQARINQLKQEGNTLEMATAIAGKERAVAQAQINSSADLSLFNLKNQAGVAAAVTGAERIRAQEIATTNSLLQQGVSLEQAQAIAAQERANAEAAVNAAIERQIIALNESTQLIHAQIADMREQAGAAQQILGYNEINVRVQQAYNAALREGAAAAEASALASATLNNLLAQRAMQLEKIAQAEARVAQQAIAAAEQEYEATSRQMEQEREASNKSRGDAAAAGWNAVFDKISAAGKAGSLTGQAWDKSFRATGLALNPGPEMASILQKAEQEVADMPINQRQEQGLDQLKSLQDQNRLGGAATPQEKAQIQWQITYEQLRKEGVYAELARKIADQELANTMQDLAKSVDANTSALQDQLDPIYTEGKAALRIGYYGEGAGGTMRTVTGTGFATPANSNVPAVPSQAAPSQAPASVVINNNFPPGAVMGDRRTQYLAANSYGRAVMAMS
jgi:hypothetical protein